MSGMEKVQEILEALLGKMGFTWKRITIRKGELEHELVFDVVGGNAFLLAHKHKDALSSLTYLLRALAEREGGIDTHFSVDIDGIRAKHIEEIQRKAIEAAEEILTTGNPKELPPMTSFERKVVHSALERITKVKTQSEGEGKDRKIVIFKI